MLSDCHPGPALNPADITESSGLGKKRRLNLLIWTVWVSLIQVDGGFKKVNELHLLLWSSVSCFTTASAELISVVATRADTVRMLFHLPSPLTIWPSSIWLLPIYVAPALEIWHLHSTMVLVHWLQHTKIVSRQLNHFFFDGDVYSLQLLTPWLYKYYIRTLKTWNTTKWTKSGVSR